MSHLSLIPESLKSIFFCLEGSFINPEVHEEARDLFSDACAIAEHIFETSLDDTQSSVWISFAAAIGRLVLFHDRNKLPG